LFELGAGGAIEAFDVFFYFGGAVAGAKRDEGFKMSDVFCVTCFGCCWHTRLFLKIMAVKVNVFIRKDLRIKSFLWGNEDFFDQ